MFFSSIVSIPVDISSRLDIGNFFRITDIGALTSSILTLALIFGTLIFIVYFLLSSFEWLTAGEDKGKLESARNRMMNAFTGIVLLAASWGIFLIVIYITGLPIKAPLIVNEPTCGNLCTGTNGYSDGYCTDYHCNPEDHDIGECPGDEEDCPGCICCCED